MEALRFHQIGPFKKHLRSSFPDHLLPVYLIQGKSEEGRKEALDTIQELFHKDLSPFSIKSFDAKEFRFEDFYGEINTLMAFEKLRLVVLKNAQALTKTFLQELKKYLAHPNTSVCLVIEASFLGKDLAAAVEKSGAFLDLLPEKSWEKEKRVGQWIDQMVRKRSMQIDQAAKDCLLRWVGTSKQELELELEKLMTYALGKKQIVKEDVMTICTYHSQETVWKLYDAILAREPLKALYVLRSLIHENLAPQMLISQIRGHFQMLLKILHAQSEEGMKALLKQHFYLKGKLLERHKGAARAYGEQAIKQALIDVYETDLKTREGLEDTQALLESLITKLTLKKAYA